MKPAYLHDPTFIELDDAYRGLPRFGEVLVSSKKIDHALQDMEKVGFVGLKILVTPQEGKPQKIIGYKGKHGPCHFAGAEATYEGAAFAVHHMIPRAEGGPDEDWNLCTLCSPCHPSVDAQPGFAKIPTDNEGNSYVNKDEILSRWSNYYYGEPT